MEEARSRAWLKRRLEIEARADAGADARVKQIRWGRVLAFLETGVAFGWWSRKAATAYSDAIYFGARKSSTRRLDA